MRNVLIIGATGRLGRAATQTLLTETDDHITLFARSAANLRVTDPARERVIAGDVMNARDLAAALAGQDTVFAALSGDLGTYATKLVAAMERQRVARLVFITSMGIYNEIPASVGGGNLNTNPILRPYRAAADVIEASSLAYTIIRPGWFTPGPVNYEITHKGEPFGGHNVSIRSIADLVKRLVDNDQLYRQDSVVINTPQ